MTGNEAGPRPLPIDPLLPGIVRALEERNVAVVCAEPGAGKTTRVPPALLSVAFAQDRQIWVLQPRRIAAKLAALRVSSELGEPVGETVGYHFRFERCAGPRTRLLFLTDGMLLPLARTDPALKRVAAVVLDEFHERSLALELSLGFLKRLQSTDRPDLRLVVMSATLDAETLAPYLGGAPVFRSSGRVFPVGVEYLPQPEEPDLSRKVRAAVRQALARGPKGTVLVFLPGVPEIHRAERALEGLSAPVFALYGDLPIDEQQAILAPATGNKVILSTNVAETSLTVPGVTCVIDSGLTRQARVSPWSGLERLVTVPASQASAAQRAGRAGRLQEGTCFRLYSKFDFEHRAAFDVPEISRCDLSRALLDLKSLNVDDLGSFPWFLKPPEAALQAAVLLLKRIGALDERGAPTQDGQRMSRFPVPPRLARFLLSVQEATKDPAVLRAACRMAAMLGEEDSGSEDLLEALEKGKPDFTVRRLEGQLADLLGCSEPPRARHASKELSRTLSRALLSGFPDRVARVRRDEKAHTRNKGGRDRELLLSSGGSAVAPDTPLLRAHEFFVLAEAQETAGGKPGPDVPGARAQARARALCPIEEDWLLDLFPDSLSEEEECRWDEDAQRVEISRRLKYDQLVLDEKPLPHGAESLKAAEVLFKEAFSAGPQAYCDPDELSSLLNRTHFTAERVPGFSELTGEDVRETLIASCMTCRSFKDLRESGFLTALRGRLSPKDLATLERTAPARVTLASGRQVPVHYEAGRPPWIESRVQDFFGMSRGPCVGEGEVPLVLHLLAPNRRPVQVTSDLAGFWRNHYPQVRREMMRRYPKHKWPDRP